MRERERFPLGRPLKKCALTTCAITAIACSKVVNAQAAEAYKVDIKVQELDAALIEFGIQTCHQVLFVETDVEGKKTPKIEGRYTTDQAIYVMLDGSKVYGQGWYCEPSTFQLISLQFNQSLA